jgi:plastocyanin
VSHLSATRVRTSRLARGVAVLAMTLAALTACGGSDDGDATATTSAATSSPEAGESAPTGETSAPAETQSITATEADFSISLDREDLTAGTYDVEVVNDGSATHDLVVERDGDDVAASEDIGPGASTTLTVALEPGEYVFYCSIGNHRAMGMELTVTVT